MGNQAMYAFTAKPPYVSAAEPNLCDPRDAPWFMIGMAHLDSQGLSLSWLLREAVHLHWSSVAEHAGHKSNEIRDLHGNRALPGVVAVVLTGRADAFREDDVVELRLAHRPSPLNGWRSVTELQAITGAVFTVELVTSFAVRAASSNQSLEMGSMPQELMAERGTSASRRTDHIRRMGSSARREAEASMATPALSVQISSHLHCNGLGLTCFTALHNLFLTAEENAYPTPQPSEIELDHRRLHFFGNLDAGDKLDISTVHETRHVMGQSCLAVVSNAKRRADGLVVAVCESVYRR